MVFVLYYPLIHIFLPLKGVKIINILTPNEIRQYYKAATQRYSNEKLKYRLGYGLVLILFTGLRLGEALGLQWEDVDFENRTLSVECTQQYVKNRNAKNDSNNYIFVEGTTKTVSSERVLPLNQMALKALHEIKKINGQFKFVFSNSKGNLIMIRNLNRMHDNILESARLKHIGVHALRHTFASQLFANGVNVKVVSKLLGHSEVGITYNTYIHLLKEDMPSATDSLDKIMSA